MTRILTVDDDVEQLRALSRAFTQIKPGLLILTAASGLQAKQLLRQRAVDLVLTDVRMPEMDGLELLSWMQESLPDVPAFTMSADTSPELAEALNRFDGVEAFHKPLDPQAVLERLMQTLSHSVRGHVQHVSLASFLQLLEMERKSCSLAVECGDKTGTLELRCGALVAARAGELDGEQAAIEIIAWPYPSISITRATGNGAQPLQASLGFMVMEAMRVQDEAARQSFGSSDGATSAWTPLRTWRPPSGSEWPRPGGSSRPQASEPVLPSGARAIAIVDTASGEVLTAAARADCPLSELSQMAAHVLRHELATVELCSESEALEELVLSSTSRCDVIRPLGESTFALLVFAPEDTNLVMARIELEQFIAAHEQQQRDVPG